MSALFNYKLVLLDEILCKSMTCFILIHEYFNPTVLAGACPGALGKGYVPQVPRSALEETGCFTG